jgi:hypothetical protein
MGGAPVWTMGRDNGALREPIDPALLGSAELVPSGAFAAGSYQNFTLVYTAGRYGIDDTGSLRVCFRFASDQSNPQFGEPQAAGYTTVEASNGAVLELRFDPKGNIRPWDRTLLIKVVRGYLREGDRITIRLGDPRRGSPGMRLQTFCEDSFEFRVLVDPIATFNFQPLPEQPEIRIVPGPPERYVAVIPTLRRTGESFALKVKGEDRWGNPSDRCDVELALETAGPIGGAPASVRLAPGQRAVELPGLVGTGAGEGFVTLVERAGHRFRSNPIRFETAPAFVHFWGDLHGQSEETVGNNSAEAYFRFARDLAFVDACAHQGNDFQITSGFWAELNRLTNRRLRRARALRHAAGLRVVGQHRARRRSQRLLFRGGPHHPALLARAARGQERSRDRLHDGGRAVRGLGHGRRVGRGRLRALRRPLCRHHPGARRPLREVGRGPLVLGHLRVARPRRVRCRLPGRHRRQLRRPQGPPRRQLSGRGPVRRDRRAHLLPDAGARARDAARLPAPPPPLRHHGRAERAHHPRRRGPL